MPAELREILRAWLIDAEEGELKLGERIVVSRGWKPLVPAPALVQAQAIEIALTSTLALAVGGNHKVPLAPLATRAGHSWEQQEEHEERKFQELGAKNASLL